MNPVLHSLLPAFSMALLLLGGLAPLNNRWLPPLATATLLECVAFLVPMAVFGVIQRRLGTPLRMRLRLAPPRFWPLTFFVAGAVSLLSFFLNYLMALATGGATLSALTGLPYLLCTLIIGVFIFVVAIFGTDLVRKVASVLSICIIAGLLIVYIPNIIAGLPQISDTINLMTAQKLPLSAALYSAFIYGTFQLSNIAVFVQHAKSFEKPGDAVKSMGIGFVVNALMMVMVVLGLMTVYTNPEAAAQDVPTLFMVQNGVGASFMTPLISILIILGAVSTAVNMVAAMVKRICGDGEKTAAPQSQGKAAADKNNAAKTGPRISRKEIIAALICCIVDFGIAQFGLLTLIQRAYSIIAYLAIPVILIPYVIHMIVTASRRIRRAE